MHCSKSDILVIWGFNISEPVQLQIYIANVQSETDIV